MIRAIRVTGTELDVALLAAEFPSIDVRTGSDGDLVIDEIHWRGAFDLGRYDDAIERLHGSLHVCGDDAVGVAFEVLGRYQRLSNRRNRASAAPEFDAILRGHAALFPRDELEHALDVWQWTLRLEPEIGIAYQVAALFHGFDRVDLPDHERREHRMRAAAAPSDRLAAVIGDILDEPSTEQVLAALEAERSVVDDADALSFLSLRSDTYADHFGGVQTRRKIQHIASHLGTLAREKLAYVRIRPDVERVLHEVAAGPDRSGRGRDPAKRGVDVSLGEVPA